MQSFFVTLQKITPQHALTVFLGWFANTRIAWLKNSLITLFIKHYHVNMSEALEENPQAYPTFNLFFIRHLKQQLRPITEVTNEIASPVDGLISQLGTIKNHQLTQAKGMYFSLESLLHDKNLSDQFNHGSFITLYLAPRDYHRIHMPLAGVLKQTIYIPGKLFSVNKTTSELIPNIYARNERVISIFETSAGTMAVILIGALIVGSIKTSWLPSPLRFKNIQNMTPITPVHLNKGDELGYFKLGSTVILLFSPNRMDFLNHVESDRYVQYGSSIGKIK